MADDNKPGTNNASGTIIVAALAAMGVYYFNHEVPLVDLRPAATDARIQLQAPVQTVEARLWQDPIAAVQKSRDESSKQNPEQQCQGASSDGPCKSPLAAGDKDALVLAVTVRRRGAAALYAVLAGLERAGFVPTDARHISYFLWKQDDQNHAPTHVGLDIPVSLSPLFSLWKPVLDHAPQDQCVGITTSFAMAVAYKPSWSGS